MDNTQNVRFDSKPEDDNSGIKIFLNQILSKWLWFFVSCVLCLTIAYIKLKYTIPIYTTSARVFIRDDDNGKSAGAGISAFTDLFNPTSTVDNEAEILKTRYLMERVVQEMKADIVYAYEGRVNATELYKSPFEVVYISKKDTIKPNKFLVAFNGSQIKVYNKDFSKNIRFNENLILPDIGTVQIKRTQGVGFVPGTYSFAIASFDQKVAEYMSDLSVLVGSKQVSIITLSFNYPLKNRAEDILRLLIQQYQLENLTDKNRIADSTISFIQNRLIYVSKELNDVEGNIQDFKQSNNLADMATQSKLVVENSNQNLIDLQKTNVQIEVLNQLESYIKDEKKNRRIFPNDLIDDPSFSALIQKNNSLILDRERQLLSSTEANPYVQNIDEQISGLRKDMLSLISNARKSLLIAKNSLQQRIGQLEGQVHSVPEKERTFLNLSRQQQIKQELYLFLAQKREETAISKTSNISNSRVIDPPKAGEYPISPNKKVIYILGLIIGLAIPLLIIYVKDVLNNRVNTKDDVRRYTQIPILAEISHSDDNSLVVINPELRTVIAEQFRALRTNLSFLLKMENKQSKTIMVTSSMASEGKSFTVINLGIIFAMTGKKVLIMEMDLRKPSLSSRLGIVAKYHYTDYILDDAINPHDIVNKTSTNENLFLISSGAVPPNPAEIIMSSRMSELMSALSQEFDYIIMDTPPIGLVTDAQILAGYSDLTLYLVRCNFTFKSQLNIAEELHYHNKIKNMNIVINDVDLSDSYGYNYGYYYGSYLDDKRSKLGWLGKLRNKKDI